MPRIVLTLPLLFALANCDHSHGGGHPHEAPASAPAASVPSGPAKNPVQAEMRLLNQATRDWVTAIAQNQLNAIPAGMHEVHIAREATEKALKEGKYTPPKAGTNSADFARQDAAFHDELVRLLEASKKNDLAAATKQLGVVLQGCTDCHQKYRF